MKKRIVYIFIVIFLLSFSVPKFIFSLIPPSKKQIERYKKDGSLKYRIKRAKALENNKVSISLLKRYEQKMRFLLMNKGILKNEDLGENQIVPPAWEGMPTTGTVKIPVILISFQDTPNINSKLNITNKIFGNGDVLSYPLESLRNFYKRSSYNKLNIKGNVLGWYKTAYPRSEVESKGINNLIMEVLDYYDSKGHDFSQYDNDNDGDIDYLVVIWAGEHGEWASFWWAYQSEFNNSNYKIDGKKLGKYSWQWESYNYPYGKFDPSTLIHETGHALGLPDLYDYEEGTGPEGGVGGLDMMDSVWGDHNCFSKFMLGWIEPLVIQSGESQLSLNPSSLSEDALIIFPGASKDNFFGEFFMVQNRSRIGNDKKIPNDGLIVWHVDSTLDENGNNFKFDNSYSEHKYLKLMQADGLDQIEDKQKADAGDFFVDGKMFTPATDPNSSRYDGSNTGVFIKDIYRINNRSVFNTGIDIPLEIKLSGERFEEKSWIVKNFYVALSFSVDFFREISVIKYSVERKEFKGVYESVKDIFPDELTDNSIDFNDMFIQKDKKYYYRIAAYGSTGSVIAVSNELIIE